MSVNITVNGKFSKSSQILNPEGYKKHLENERRKLRLQQVRAQSKELARKIRADVSQEKQRQLRNLEAVKAQELNLWRKNVVAQKQNDVKKALKQVGSAHVAARKEKELTKERKQPRTPSPKKKTFLPQKRKENTQKPQISNVVDPKQKEERNQQKINVNFDDICEVICLSDTESEREFREYEIIDITDFDITDSSSSSSDYSPKIRSYKETKSTQTAAASKNTLLKRAPPVMLDVDTEPIQSDFIAAPTHIIDKHVETNRQFDSVVNKEPTKNNACTQTMATTNDKSTLTLDNIEPSPPRPRYTQISDLIAKQKRTELEKYPENTLEANVAVNKGVSYTVLRSAATSLKDKETIRNTREGVHNNTPEQCTSGNAAASYTASTPGDSTSSTDRAALLNPQQTASVNRTAPKARVHDEPSQRDKIVVLSSRNKILGNKPEKIASHNDIAPKSKTVSLNRQNNLTGHMIEKNTSAHKDIPIIARNDPTSNDRIPSLPPQTNPNMSISIQRRKKIYQSRFSPMTRLSSTSGITTTSAKDTDENVARGTVQSYDYVNKFSKEYKEMPNATVLPENNIDEPDAMEEAELEKQRLILQEKKTEEFRRKSEARGQTALEREKVRRDLADLTQKLDALMQKRPPLVPSDANLHSKAYLAGKSAQKEAKINSAIEELLTRPVIITCPERRKEMPKTSNKLPSLSQKEFFQSSDLNLGSRLLSGESDNGACRNTDTDDSRSILLGYIDDQRDQLKSELSQCDDSAAKSNGKREKLTQLLKRIEALRESLLIELHKKPDEKSDCIGDAKYSKTKPNDLINPSKKYPDAKESTKQEEPPLNRRERELKDREKLLQRELEEVFRTQQQFKADQVKSATVKIISGKEQISEQTTVDKPLEIVIKVKGDSKSSKRKVKKIQNKIAEPKESLPEPSCNNQYFSANRRVDRVEGSYDSNSTAYKSMPSALNAVKEPFIDHVKQLDSNKKQRSSSLENTRSSSSTSVEVQSVEVHKRPRSHLHPLISQYIQRLLGMTRESVRALEVSSSEIDSLSSSVINISTNVTSSSGLTGMLSEDRLQRVEQFVNENRGFINELEESLRTHSNETLEASLRHFENIWKEKLKRDTTKENCEREKQISISKNRKIQTEKEKPKKSAPKTVSKTLKKSEKTHENVDQKKVQVKSTKVTKLTVPVVDKDTNKEADAFATQSQLNHYAELTKNCSNRIAELTALITKVRQEKQRILEVTLTSVSDNDRHSTEYADLPQTRNKDECSIPDTTKKTSEQHSSPTKKTQRLTENEPTTAPLEKHKQIGRSRDSGISMPSRPVTALGHDTETDPHSFASSTRTITNTITQSSASFRKPHPPPPTIHRYSPQLPEEDIVHELSTIVEVDTPATSRINTSIQHPQSEQQRSSEKCYCHPKPFPTFEEYVKELNLDLSMLDPEESLRMEHEYNELVEALKCGKGNKAYSYEEFPTLITYLKSVTGNDETSGSPETIEDLFGCLRLSTIMAKPFPSHREYLECISVDSIVKGIDSESLENLTEHQTARSESESDTLNIEEELKRRNILKHSFRTITTKRDACSTSTDSKNPAKPKSSTGWTTLETGVGMLSSTSDSASDKFQRELLALGLKWHKSMRSKEKQAAALSSSTSEPNQSNSQKETKSKTLPNDKQKKNKSICEVLSDSESSERPLNLRDFLTRQLLKHVTATSTCDSSLSGESLRSQFFMAVLDSMTPSGSPRTNTASQSIGQNNLERQKTSTPVRTTPAVQSRVINEHSKSNETSPSQLFSAESSLSSVQHPERKRTSKKKKSPTRKRDDG